MVLTKEEIFNLFVSAIEGGSNYWYFLPDLDMVEMVKGKTLVENIMNSIYANKKLEIPVHDVEDEDEVLGYISYDNLKRADQFMKLEANKWIVKDVKSENDDANTGDSWFQLVVLGDIVYG